MVVLKLGSTFARTDRPTTRASASRGLGSLPDGITRGRQRQAQARVSTALGLWRLDVLEA